MLEKIEQFITDTASINPTQAEIITALRATITDQFPALEEGFKYGGIIYSLDGDLLGGIFAYKAHLSLEFSYGANFADPEKRLEGKGKLRRHIKLRAISDITEKKVAEFCAVAFEA